MTQQERDRFSAYLEQEIETHRGMADVMKKSKTPFMDEMVKREEGLAMAKAIVLKDLLAGEDFTVSA